MESQRSSPDQPGDEAAQSYDLTTALDDVAAARRQVADRLVTPWWYHPALGTALAVWALATAWASQAWSVVASFLVIGTALALMVAYQRITGIWVGPAQTGPRSRQWWLTYAALVVAVLLTAALVRWAVLPTWSAAVGAVAALVGTIVLGRTMDNVLREEIRTGKAALPAGRTR